MVVPSTAISVCELRYNFRKWVILLLFIDYSFINKNYITKRTQEKRLKMAKETNCPGGRLGRKRPVE
jgi:hypothetical protein